MDNCSKIIKETSFFGIKTHRNCLKPIHKDGLCAKHYRRMVEKSTLYGNREGYRQATQNDLDRMRNLKLKVMGSYGGHVCVKGAIVSSNGNNKPTTIAPNPELFVVRDIC